MGEIYLIRHGQSIFTRGNFDRLSEIGTKQMEILGGYLARLGVKPDAIYAGSMRRQVVAAKLMMAKLMGESEPRPLIVPEFSEMDVTKIVTTFTPALLADDPAVMEDSANMYRDRAVLQKLIERSLIKWLYNKRDDHFYIKESYGQFASRVKAGLDRVIGECGEGKKVIIVSSFGPIGVVAKMALNLTDEDAIRMSFATRNSSISVFDYSDQGISLRSFNSTAHLELEGDPELITVR